MFDSTKRLIYRHRIEGFGLVYADPLRALRIMTEILGGSPNTILSQAKDQTQPAELRYKALGQLVMAVRTAFETPELDSRDGDGVTDTECIQLLQNFLNWVSKKKLTVESWPTSSAPTVSHPDTDSITKAMSGFISTGNESGYNEPGIMPEELESGGAILPFPGPGLNPSPTQ